MGRWKGGERSADIGESFYFVRGTHSIISARILEHVCRVDALSDVQLLDAYGVGPIFKERLRSALCDFDEEDVVVMVREDE